MTVKRISIIFLLLLGLWVTLLISNSLPVPEAVKNLQAGGALKVLDRHGQLLRETLSTRGGRRQTITLQEVSPDFIRLLVTTEDQRYFQHSGVDPFALMRAVFHSARAGRVVSGGSTLTMQTVRLALPGERTLSKKVSEIFSALYLEMTLSKEQILELYINNMPLSQELYGLSAASETYFRKKPKELSLSESAYLIGIVRAPSLYNPYKNAKAVLALKEKILKNFEEICPGESLRVATALKEAIVIYPSEHRFRAPHFTDFVINQVEKKQGTIRTSLDLELNEKIEEIIKTQISSLTKRQVTAASALVVSNKTGEILGYVGSADYWDLPSLGMNDGVLQWRQPGSSLKPFTYARALDLGFAPTHVMADVRTVYPSPIGDYIPGDYDRRYRGPVLMREALANSLNIPAVQLLSEIGVTELYQTLKDAGFSQLTHDPSYYGLGLTLGNVEVSLYELVRGYLVFINQGEFKDLTFESANHARVSQKPVFSKKAVSVVRDFLSDAHARTTVFGNNGPLDFDYPVMIKTGTSQGYRDNWTVAVTPLYTVGVWAGNFNGDSMQDVSGVTGAAPIAHEIVEYLHQQDPWTAWPDSPSQKKIRVCSLSGKRPTENCPHTRLEFADDETQIKDCNFHVSKDELWLPSEFAEWQMATMPETIMRASSTASQNDQTPGLKILSPQNGAVYKVDVQRPREGQYLSLKTTPTNLQFHIILDDRELSVATANHIDLIPGEHHLELVSESTQNAQGQGQVLDQIRFWVR